jgi:hypothetical protein
MVEEGHLQPIIEDDPSATAATAAMAAAAAAGAVAAAAAAGTTLVRQQGALLWAGASLEALLTQLLGMLHIMG